VSLTGVWASHLEGTWAEYAELASAEQQGIVKDAASMTHHLTGGPISRSGTGKYSVKKFPDSHRRPDESPQKNPIVCRLTRVHSIPPNKTFRQNVVDTFLSYPVGRQTSKVKNVSSLAVVISCTR